MSAKTPLVHFDLPSVGLPISIPERKVIPAKAGIQSCSACVLSVWLATNIYSPCEVASTRTKVQVACTTQGTPQCPMMLQARLCQPMQV